MEGEVGVEDAKIGPKQARSWVKEESKVGNGDEEDRREDIGANRKSADLMALCGQRPMAPTLLTLLLCTSPFLP